MATATVDLKAMFVEHFGIEPPSKGHLLLGIGMMLRDRPDAEEIVAALQEEHPGFGTALIEMGLKKGN